MEHSAAPPGSVRWGTPAARRALITCVLGTSMAFLDATVVNVALPRISKDLGTGIAGIQWVVDSYLVLLSALVLLGGALGDRYGRKKVFVVGVYSFAAASVLCAVAPNIQALVVARGLQGAAGALLVPGSLALLSSVIDTDDRSRAVGAWSGLSGVAGAIGPLVGGWLVDALSWQWVFFINLPVAAAVIVAARGVQEVAMPAERTGLDVGGALMAAAALGISTAGAIDHGKPWSTPAIVAGLAGLVGFVVLEGRRTDPMMPPSLFRSAQFSGANGATLGVYAGLGTALFLVVVNLQNGLGYSALEAGAALSPVTLVLLLLSSRMGALAQRAGPRAPMTVGPLLAGGGLVWLAMLRPGDRYGSAVLPGALVLGLGMAVTVAPLTSAVMSSVEEAHLGIASGINNAVARLAGLVGVAVIPAVAGINLTARAAGGIPGYRTGMIIGAALTASGGVIAALTIRSAVAVLPTVPVSIVNPCHDPCRKAA